jgi:hypothetical protein
MTGLITRLYTLLLHFTNHCMTYYVSFLHRLRLSSPGSFNSSLSCLRSSLYSLGESPTENIVSWQFICSCTGVFILPLHRNDILLLLHIHYRGNLFTESLSSNGRLFWLRYSGFRFTQLERRMLRSKSETHGVSLNRSVFCKQTQEFFCGLKVAEKVSKNES